MGIYQERETKTKDASELHYGKHTIQRFFFSLVGSTSPNCLCHIRGLQKKTKGPEILFE